MKIDIKLHHTRLKKTTVLASSRQVIVLLLLLAILATITGSHTLPAFAGTGGSSCGTALEIPLNDTYTGFVTSSIDDWFKVYISSPGYMSVGVFNNQVSSTDMSLQIRENGCSTLIDTFYCPKGYNAWPIQEGDLYVTPGYYYVGFSCVGSCSDMCWFNFRVAWDAPPPEVGSISVNSNLSGAGFTLSGPSGVSAITPYTDSNADPGTYTVTWFPISGYDTPDPETKTLTAGDSISFYGNYQAQPENPPTADFSSDVQSCCDPLTVYFTDLSTAGDNPIVSWYWEFGDGDTSTAQDPSHIYDDGVYTVSLTVADSHGCSDTETKEAYITSNEGPTADFSASPTSGCSPLKVDFSDNSVAGDNPIISWYWEFGDGYTSTDQHPSHTYDTAGTYTVTLTVTDEHGCTDDATTNVVINTKPVGSATSNSPVCEGATIRLYGGPGGMASYSWTGPGGWTSSLQNPTRPNATTAMAGTYTSTVTGAHGCSDTETETVTVYAKPTATASGNSPVPQGGTIQLYGGPDGMASYDWTGPGGWTSSLQNPTLPNATMAMAGTYTLTVTDEHGCSDDATTTVVVTEKDTTPLTITGHVRFKGDNSDTFYDAMYVEVGVHDAASWPDECIKIGHTKEDGTFSFTTDQDGNPISIERSDGKSREIYVEIVARNEAARVKSSLLATAPYTWVSGTKNPPADGVVDFGTLSVETGNSGALGFLFPAQMAHDRMEYMTGYDAAQVRVVYPWSREAYEDEWGKEAICMSRISNTYQDNYLSAFYHEYGHFVHDQVRGGTLPGSIDEQTQHNEETDAGTALSEGWATFFAEAILHSPGEYPMDSNVEIGVSLGEKEANMVEGCVTAVLWDLYDHRPYEPPPPDVDDDSVQESFSKIWHILADLDPDRMYSEYVMGGDDFYHYWIDEYGLSQGVHEVFKMNGFPVPDPIILTLTCPVDMVITDPDDLVVSKDLNEIAGATYTEIDLNGDGDLDDIVVISDPKIGDYLISIIPEPGASPADMYSLEISTGDVAIVLAEDAEIGNTPSAGHVVRWTETGIGQIDGCFVATAAYGTPMAEEIEILREFRDEYVLTNPVGQALVDLYYTVSPPMADFIAEHPSLKPVARAGLVPAVAMSSVVVNTTLAEKTALAGLLVLVSVALAVWATRRRGKGSEPTQV